MPITRPKSKEHGELQDMGVTWARAGCLVLVMDQLGHGERRQHPCHSAADYARPFQAGRQDYYFRYDLGSQLHLVNRRRPRIARISVPRTAS